MLRQSDLFTSIDCYYFFGLSDSKLVQSGVGLADVLDSFRVGVEERHEGVLLFAMQVLLQQMERPVV